MDRADADPFLLRGAIMQFRTVNHLPSSAVRLLGHWQALAARWRGLACS